MKGRLYSNISFKGKQSIWKVLYLLQAFELDYLPVFIHWWAYQLALDKVRGAFKLNDANWNPSEKPVEVKAKSSIITSRNSETKLIICKKEPANKRRPLLNWRQGYENSTRLLSKLLKQRNQHSQRADTITQVKSSEMKKSDLRWPIFRYWRTKIS